jgi:signal transduction histidine kinase
METLRRETHWQLLHRRPILVLAFLATGGALVIWWHIADLSQSLIESKTLRDAELYSEALSEFRTLYTSEVVDTVVQRGIEATHDYKAKEGAIPLPATLSLLLGKRIGQHGSGAETRLYSPYPFPWRQAEGGLRDRFAEDAWGFLQSNPDKAFHRFEESRGRQLLRYATADRMRVGCVNCHNSHPDSPKKGWKEGDVRGVLEVVFPMHAVAAETRSGLRGTLALMAALTAGGLGMLALVIRRLRRTSVELENRVADLREREEQIRTNNEALLVARDAALEASRAKSQFLANMSHELRTPLNHIFGYTEILREDAVEKGSKNLLSDLEKIRTASHDLLQIVNDVLDISAVETGKTEMHLGMVAVASTVRDVVSSVAPMLEKSGNALDTHIAEGTGTMHTDGAKVRQCLLQLLSNACKFTQRGTIWLTVTRETENGRDWLRFSVRDTGIGMTREQMAVVFQPFTQADASSTRKYGGTGLGLAITRSFCQLLGGDISVESALGRGSTFTLRLPAEVQERSGGASAASGEQ